MSVLIDEHVRIVYPRLLERSRARMGCKTSRKKKIYAERAKWVGAPGSLIGGERVLQRNCNHSAEPWGILGLAALEAPLGVHSL